MLSSLPGVAVSSIKIDGILHEFSTIPGVKEDVTEVLDKIRAQIEDYLRGKVGFEVPDSALLTIFADRNLVKGYPVSELDKRTLDLATADLYMYCASTPSVKGSTEDSHGGWKHKDGGWESSAYDKRTLRQMANEIYAYYGEKTNSKTGTFKFIQLR